VAIFITVVPAAKIQKSGFENDGIFSVCALGCHGPARLFGRPGGPRDRMSVVDVCCDAVFVRRVLDVLANGFAICNRFVIDPWFKGIAQRVHVGVGANAGVLEQIPGAAYGFAGFQNAPTGLGAMHLQMPGRANARKTSTHNEHIHDGRLAGRLRLLRGGHDLDS
jgi:hypothetical protein